MSLSIRPNQPPPGWHSVHTIIQDQGTPCLNLVSLGEVSILSVLKIVKQRINVSRKTIWACGVIGVVAIVVLCVTPAKLRSPDRRAGHDDNRPIPTAARQSPRDRPVLREIVASIGATAIPAAWLEEGALARDKQTADKLIQFIFTGKPNGIGNITAEDVESLLQHLGDSVHSDDIAGVVEATLGIPKEMYPDAVARRKALGSLFSALAARPATMEEVPPPVQPFTPLVFTEKCADDGAILGRVDSIPAGTGRVYAVFENQGTLAGLDYVFAVWQSVDNSAAVYSHCEPLRVATTYNFVYLELEKGWPSGSYRLDLFDPRNRFQLLATKRFVVN